MPWKPELAASRQVRRPSDEAARTGMPSARPRLRSPLRAAAHSRASARPQRRDPGAAGEVEILRELPDADPAWTDLACALLNVGTNLARAAGDGRETAYLEHVVRESALDVVNAGG